VQPFLRVWHRTTAIGELRFELTKAPPEIRHGGLP
jgi:hypothetical protein